MNRLEQLKRKNDKLSKELKVLNLKKMNLLQLISREETKLTVKDIKVGDILHEKEKNRSENFVFIKEILQNEFVICKIYIAFNSECSRVYFEHGTTEVWKRELIRYKKTNEQYCLEVIKKYHNQSLVEMINLVNNWGLKK